MLRYNVVPLHSFERVEFRGGRRSGCPRTCCARRCPTGSASPRRSAAPRRRPARSSSCIAITATFARTAVAVATERHDPDRTLLEFDITPGRTRSSRTRASRASRLKELDAFLAQIHAAPSQRYEPTAITEALANYVQKLRRKSRYEATASYQARPAADGTTVDLTCDAAGRPRRDDCLRWRSPTEGQAQ